MDSLWKKTPSGIYVDIASTLPRKDQDEIAMFLTEFDMRLCMGILQNNKNNRTSTSLRKLGNIEFEKKNWFTAMTFYNRSLRYAEIGTENVSLVYANRSSCFLELSRFHECLVDIEMAIGAGYPKRLMPKLEKRRAICLEKLKNNHDSLSQLPSVPQLDFDADKNFPCMANVLKLQQNDKFGIHFIAKHDIDVGKVLLVEEPFVSSAIINPGRNLCHACFKNSANFIACSMCTNALFCSESCADDILHKIRCNRGTPADDPLMEFVLRSMVHAMSNFTNVDILDFVKSVITSEHVNEVPNELRDMKSKYRLFLKLNLWFENDEVQLRRLTIIGIQVYHLLLKQPSINDMFDTESSKRFFMHLCIMHAYIVSCNSFQTDLCGGIYLLHNHFNHSCAPNVLCSRHENKSVLVTSRRIKKGDQLFISYNGMCFFEPKRKRQQKLYEDFGFWCDCEKCQHVHWPTSSKHVKSDPDMQMLENADKSLKKITYDDIPRIVALKKKCLEILNKYSDQPWCEEFDKVSHWYQHLSVETTL